MSSTPTTSRHGVCRFDPDLHLDWLHGLWQRSMDPRWHLSANELRRKISGATLSFVAERSGDPVAFCAAAYGHGVAAGLLCLLVDPNLQHHGVGSDLLLTLQSSLLERGVETLHLGFGSGGDYFWPGVPSECKAAWSFFAARGWKESESSFDLVQDLSVYQTPPWVYDRLARTGVHLRLADPSMRDRIEAFEQSRFPAWRQFFANEMAERSFGNILVATSPDGSIAGTVLLRAAGPVTWNQDLGITYGSLNTLGVASDLQGQGIGIALTARAMEILQDRDCSRCYIQWTGLLDWYGKLGARVWAQYHMASKRL